MTKPCVDCKAAGRALTRPAPHPGPRCATDHRAFKAAQKARNHDKAVARIYGLAPGDYARLLEAQGGSCAISGCRATGKSKRLAVDHDHASGEVRGLLCSSHNRLIGLHRDNADSFRSIAAYLESPPARLVLLDHQPDVSVSSGITE